MLVPSSTTPGLDYITDGNVCECPGFRLHQKCKHIKIFKQQFMEENQFQADGVRLKTFKGSEDLEVVFSTGIYQWDQIKNLQTLRGNLKITVEVLDDAH